MADENRTENYCVDLKDFSTDVVVRNVGGKS